MGAALRSNATTGPSWQTDTAPPRACVLCDYGRDLATEATERGRLCRQQARPTPTDAARRQGGACGPEAKFLTIKGVEL